MDEKRRNQMKSIMLFIAIAAAWFVLNKWVLPKFGIST